jgi:hypothetical protein
MGETSIRTETCSPGDCTSCPFRFTGQQLLLGSYNPIPNGNMLVCHDLLERSPLIRTLDKSLHEGKKLCPGMQNFVCFWYLSDFMQSLVTRGEGSQRLENCLAQHLPSTSQTCQVCALAHGSFRDYGRREWWIQWGVVWESCALHKSRWHQSPHPNLELGQIINNVCSL